MTELRRHFLRLSLLLMAVLLATFNSVAQEQSKTSYPTPDILSKAPMQTPEDALALLVNDSFHQQLANLAMQFPAENIEQQNLFNKVALKSILSQHDYLLVDVPKLKNGITFTHYRLHSQTLLKMQQNKGRDFARMLSASFKKELHEKDDEALYQIHNALGWSVENAQDYAFNVFKRYKDLTTLEINQAVDLIVNIHLYKVLASVIPITQELLDIENNRRYIIEPEVLIKTPDGVEITATIVRNKRYSGKRPTAFQFTIYADQKSHITTAMHAAAHGYVGVIANTRGKRLSSNKLVPWEHDGEDAARVIDWITQQDWSNDDVVMYGGSYNGFTQWAAAKHMPSALRAMAPYTAASLITGLPYENNIVLTGNYEWAFYATNNNTVDKDAYSDWQKSSQLLDTLYQSGRPISDIDNLDGKPNPWFQKWLQHPGFDEYYQAMVPYQHEYAEINIPVLTVTGYFDGGQISAVDYLTRHYKYNDNADHTLLIGPYNHGTAQGLPRAYHSNYKLDDAALDKDTEEVVFAWFDHLLYGKSKPGLLKDNVNYQLMGSNQWRHVGSFDALNQQSKTYFFGTKKDENDHYVLLTEAEKSSAAISQSVDMTDRTQQHNLAPWPVIQEKLVEPNGLILMTAPFQQTMELAGAITGYFNISVNKRDVDIGYNFYEINKDGKAFHLNNYRSRASYAKDMGKRELLKPNQKTQIPIVNARMTAKLIEKGSRLAIVLNVNKNRDAQVNLGSGKEVNQESIDDAGETLNLKWFNDSVINIPLKSWKK